MEIIDNYGRSLSLNKVVCHNIWRRGLKRSMEGYNRLEAFDFETNYWEAFQERLEQLFEVNGHAGTGADDLVRQRGILLNVCSRKLYDLLCTLSAPKKPKKKSYAELCTLLSSRCSKKPSLIMRRFKFHSPNRHQNESITH